ncbi:MAG: peptidoglycan-associated lipoprotein Pal [Pseudomonadota bacterium]
MKTDWLRAGLSLVVAGALLAGCASNPPAEEEPSPADNVERDAPPPVPAQPSYPAFNTDGNPNIPGTNQALSRTFYFGYDQATLSQNDLAILEMHADVLSRYPAKRVTIQGHCDERGTREYNLALGERRADTVRRFLLSAGVRSNQIATVSYGEERPEDPGHSEASWSRNRRAIILYPR